MGSYHNCDREKKKEVKSGSVATTNAPHKQSSTFSAIPPYPRAKLARIIQLLRIGCHGGGQSSQCWLSPLHSSSAYIESDTHAHANRMINLVHKMIGKDSKSLFRIIKLTVDRKITENRDPTKKLSKSPTSKMAKVCFSCHINTISVHHSIKKKLLDTDAHIWRVLSFSLSLCVG
jgi:hypothetical protein